MYDGDLRAGSNSTCIGINVMNTPLSQKLLILDGKIVGRAVKIMIDSGASKNFLTTDFIDKNNLKIDRNMKDTIRLANGQYTDGVGTAKALQFHIGPYSTTSDFSVTKLTKGYDAILGKPWLTSVNPHINWRTNEVRILRKGQTIVLKGANISDNKQVNKLTSKIVEISERDKTKVQKKEVCSKIAAGKVIPSLNRSKRDADPGIKAPLFVRNLRGEELG